MTKLPLCRSFYAVFLYPSYSFLANISCVFSSDSEYDVEFKTGTEEDAGTDANVYFQMIGEESESQEIQLKNKGKGYFNRGQLDRFRIGAKDVGRVSEYPGSRGTPSYGLCRNVRRQRVWGLSHFWSEIGYRFWPFWSQIGYGTLVLNCFFFRR